ncbi:CCAAT/enhancer-binding protein gamma [Microcaecilia unicolor]|uniref:CCAAT/enhancer-binding protein gamma n=1 Tax=Microcaecilia unicolor TaxID=1415580 RepID=A0A6P7Y7F8_9AMPH|nr:CCAAT/enhancer-binding protein gamma [Microcaecilia unicolor]XP_030058669.1 CCAAT/enhancer-binding protein gamma [Microcaecilia unicolor]XP_030058678.1 CCAAT/enhancer-binding protein gamma [Microcaecilia unicolor]XP_030058686.1 CCAAT/enhancer-binding protein gamma [Microcaecilia unicolor]
MSKPPGQTGTMESNGLGAHHLPSQSSGLQQVPQLTLVSPSGGGKATPPSKHGKKGAPLERNTDEYRQRRERNNMAVKKSRLKSKQKAQDTLQRVNQLKEENERLEAKIKLLTKELSVLKDLFLEHAHNLADNVQPPSSNGTESAAAPSTIQDTAGQ